jgi:2-polyprenyl-3-methyl-5-hydroxy-6-metoxy-1,4-benzoquinol methylase
MAIRLDPDDNEAWALFEALPDWEGKRVLEVGRGDGRLTWRFAEHAASVSAIDPDEDDIAQARRQMSSGLASRLEFPAVSLEDFRPEPGSSPFDVALLSWCL